MQMPFYRSVKCTDMCSFIKLIIESAVFVIPLSIEVQFYETGLYFCDSFINQSVVCEILLGGVCDITAH
jgi:hypothetical protein